MYFKLGVHLKATNCSANYSARYFVCYSRKALDKRHVGNFAAVTKHARLHLTRGFSFITPTPVSLFKGL